jgi:hypothetical protein
MPAHTVTRTQRPVPAVLNAETDTRTLAGEHALLLRDVRRRTAPVLALIAARTWPEAELRTLTRFLHSAVLKQASDEEVAPYPTDAAAPIAELSAEHVALYTLTDRLDQADAASCPLPELAQLVNHMLAVLERHLIAERTLLAALPDAGTDMPGAAALLAGDPDLLPASDEQVLILLDALPPEQAAQMCIERLLRLRPGQAAEIHSSQQADLQRVGQWIHSFDSTRYETSPAATGLGPSLHVTARHTA